MNINKEELFATVYKEEIFTHIKAEVYPLAHQKDKFAPGWPGISARWSSSAKDGVGTALTPVSKVWFTMSQGVLNEIYYPQVDSACTRDLGFVVTNGKDFFSDEKLHTNHKIDFVAEGVPAYKLTNTCLQGNYLIEKEILTDPSRDTVLQQVKFEVLKKKIKDYKLHILLTPHLGNYGSGNTAWLGDYKGMPMLFAERDGIALALACSVPWKNSSVGFVGYSDGWQDLIQHKQLTWQFQRAENGNVSLVGEVDLQEIQGNSFTIALGFGRNAAEAGQRVRSSIFEGFDSAKEKYVQEWQNWQNSLLSLKNTKKSTLRNVYRISTSALRIHECKRHPGGLIASLSIPWGFSKGDDDLGGYHLVWPRDMVQSAGGLLAAKANDDVRRVLNYLMVTQEADGHWAQNMWLDGAPYWNGIQMDQTASPVLLVNIAHREGALKTANLHHLWPMVRKAIIYILHNGPTTHQDRWEENSGYSTYTLAVEIAALIVAADIADLNNASHEAAFMRETADAWNDNIERWTYVTNTALAKKVGVEGYYIRIAHGDEFEKDSPLSEFIKIVNRPAGENIQLIREMISPDALALVRFGLRDALDPRMVNTVKVIDAILKAETPNGPCWYRYNGDGYGEHEDGQPFNGTGIGRPWPLLTGERGHYELAAGRIDEAKNMLATLESFANDGGMIPEQIWDTNDIPDKELFRGKATGAAMPLIWAHSEYIKLCRSLKKNQVFDMPLETRQRYVIDKKTSPYFIWNFKNKYSLLPEGKILRIHLLAAAEIRWTNDKWKTFCDMSTKDTGLGIHVADLPTKDLPPGRKIQFTFHWKEASKWEDVDFLVKVDKC